MRARTLLILILALYLVPPHVAAQGAGPKLYVGTQDGQIFRVDGATGETTFLHQFQEFFLTEDVELCGDGRLYVSGFDKIGRVRTDGTEAEIIFDRADFPDDSELGNYYPEGFACDSAGNLITNERAPDASGLWRIANVTRVPFGGPFPAPERMTDAYTEWGEDVVILHDGSIAAVANIESRVDRFAPGFGERTTLIPVTGLSPVSLGQNDAGEFFVSDINQVQKYDSAGNFIEVFSTLPEGEEPLFLELDLNGNVYVAGASGLWRVDSTGTQEFVSSIPGANGVAIDLSTAPPVTTHLTFSPGDQEATVRLGNATVGIEFLGSLFNPVQTELQRILVRPSVLDEIVGPNITPLSLPGDNGLVTVLKFVDPPRQWADYSGRVQVAWSYSFGGQIEHPLVLHNSPLTSETDFSDELKFFSQIGDSLSDPLGPNPGIDPISVGEVDTLGEFVLASESFRHLFYPCNVEPSRDGSATFLVGTVVRLRFQLKADPSCVGGFPPEWGNAQLAVVRMNDDGTVTMQPVRSPTAEHNTFGFNPDNRRYSYRLVTTGYSPGRYCATISLHTRAVGALPFVTCFDLAEP